MARLVRNEQGKQLGFLLTQPDEVLIEFCKFAIEYIGAGINEKKCTVAAKKLGTTYEIVRNALEALVALLIDSTKLAVSEREFTASLQSLDGINEKQIEILWQFVISKRNLVDNIMRASCQDELYFRDLEWRIEGRIASRARPTQATPVIKMKFHLDTECVSEYREKLSSTSLQETEEHANEHTASVTRRQVLAETDPVMLQYMIQVLEKALVEARTRRVRNYVKPSQG
ncbi:COMM domain-containing protein 2 [Anopheles darlingi]|uniref:COMM domain-containing protein 2 n=1 Tax=Anopheles darlingi TaxID=43151 RepID=W5JL94_ANODA|nr:COMM domain-containing protein 2 [Anopheles darlingi]